jgi:hypothetical protein
MDNTMKQTLLALISGILAVDMNPHYQVTNVEFAKLKAVKHQAMTLQALIATETVVDEEILGLVNGYRIQDVNAAIAKYNAAQTKFVVRPLAVGETKVKSAPAPRTWMAAYDTFRTLFGLRRPEEPDYTGLM